VGTALDGHRLFQISSTIMREVTRIEDPGMAKFGRMLRRHVAAMQMLVNDRETTISEPRPGKSPPAGSSGVMGLSP
jgi:hypothetical protein